MAKKEGWRDELESEIFSWYWPRNGPSPALAYYLMEKFIRGAEKRACTKDGVQLKRGQYRFIASEMEKRMQIGDTSFRTLISALIKHKLIVKQHQTNKRATIITVCNYSSYEQDKIQSNNKPTANQRQTNMIPTNYIGTRNINTYTNNDKFKDRGKYYLDRESSTGARARGGVRSSGGQLPIVAEIATIANDSAWLAAVAEKYKTTVEAVKPLFATFRTECITNGKVQHDSLADCKSHFSNWLRIQFENSRKRHERGNTKGYDFYANTSRAEADDVDMKAAYEQVRTNGLLSDRVRKL